MKQRSENRLAQVRNHTMTKPKPKRRKNEERKPKAPLRPTKLEKPRTPSEASPLLSLVSQRPVPKDPGSMEIPRPKAKGKVTTKEPAKVVPKARGVNLQGKASATESARKGSTSKGDQRQGSVFVLAQRHV